MITETELDERVDVLNSLLRGEFAAIESYEYALSRFEGEMQEMTLQHFCNEHREAAILLRDRVIDFGGEPWVGSGPWGLFSAAVTGAAGVLGGPATLTALRRGEEHGARKFEDAITDEFVSDDCQALIGAYLLPHARRRIEGLSRLMDLSS
jgi:Domain of unknown function (DUF2383)